MSRIKFGHENEELLRHIEEISLQPIGATDKTRTVRGEACFVVHLDGSISEVGGPEVWAQVKGANYDDVKVSVGTCTRKIPGRRETLPYEVELVSGKTKLEDAVVRITSAAGVLIDAGINPESRCRIVWPQRGDYAGTPSELFLVDGELKLQKKSALGFREKIRCRLTLQEIVDLD